MNHLQSWHLFGAVAIAWITCQANVNQQSGLQKHGLITLYGFIQKARLKAEQNKGSNKSEQEDKPD